MRISCDRADQGFSPTFDQFIPTIDGVAIPYAITADEELGFIRFPSRRKDGANIEQMLFGRVKIERVH